MGCSIMILDKDFGSLFLFSFIQYSGFKNKLLFLATIAFMPFMSKYITNTISSTIEWRITFWVCVLNKVDIGNKFSPEGPMPMIPQFFHKDYVSCL